MTQSDTEIVLRVINGDSDAFELLLTKYSDHVLKILKKRLPYQQVEETAQVVFIKAYRSLPTLKNRGNFKHWLSSIAVKTCYDFWRKQYRNREFTMSSLTEKHRDWVETVMSDQSSRLEHEKNLQKEAREFLDWALDRLSAGDKMVLELVYLEGFSIKEAAELLGWSVANVKIRSFRSRKKLHQLLAELSESEENII